MLGNTFGRVFQVTTCGESYGWHATKDQAGHGGALFCIVNGVPPGLELDVAKIQAELYKRRPGQSKLDSPRKETDLVEVVSGMFEGKTTGAPLGLLVRNVDTQQVHIDQYRQVKDVIRPGHAEVNFFYKYGQAGDWCGAGRASGRETVGRVCGGAVAKQILAREGIEVLAHVIESHGIKARSLTEGSMTFEEMKANYRSNDLNCCDPAAAEKMIADLLKVREAGDTAGGVIEIVARGVPAGLGEPVFDKLKATIAHGLCSIGAMTALEFGSGARAAGMLGSEWNDQPFLQDGKVRFRTNHCGGFLGGMSNGEDLLMRMVVKPTPTVSKPQDTVDMMKVEAGKLAAITRRDISICPRIYPVAEAMVAIAVTDALFLSRGWYGMAGLDPKWQALTQARSRGEYTK
ncbi:MAG: chorismate synthase [Phycisphaerae bacterium SM23_33]|jgi:chorismate synthase|nr:MAG: chorismate synthase [Phycisphaerae bacterium SM23_33]